jgi:SecD/SecF fusion protein
MSGKLVWKLAVSIIVVIWAALNLSPLQPRDFEEHVRSQATAEFEPVLANANQRIEAARERGVNLSLYMALRQIGQEERIDLSSYFPQIRLEASLTNVQRRNAILLEELLKQSQASLQLGLDLRGGVSFTLELDERPEAVDAEAPVMRREEQLAKAIEIISSRVNALGVAEPVIRPVGDNHIEVQLPGVSITQNPEVTETLRKPARLDFRLVHPTLTPYGVEPGNIPPGYEILTLESERRGEYIAEELFVKRVPEMTGEGVSEAFASMDEFGGFRVLLRFTGEGSTRFSQITRGMMEESQRSGRLGRLAIVLDGRLYSAPQVRSEISGSAEITGQFSQREAIELANVLNNPLDVPLRIAELNEVGPSMARDAISSGVRASIIGSILVAAFILVYYTVGGLAALISLSVNLVIVLGVLASIGATLTLPGIAALILTVGMAVDSNILIFERIREEMKLGKGFPAAVQGGFEKVFSTIVDANLTTLITSAVMIWFGTGPVKGFGVTLAIGIFSTVFAALVVSRFLLEAMAASGWFKRLPMLSIVDEPKVDFLKYRRPAFAASWMIVLVGVIGVFVRYDNIWGIDFTGGDDVRLSFVQKVDEGEIMRVVDANELGEVVPLYQTAIAADATEVLRLQTQFERGSAVVAALQQAFPDAKFEVTGQSAIGPAVGREVTLNAFLALGLSLIAILIYIAFRFEMGYGVGAVVATVHDILMTIGLFVLSDRQFTAPMVAAILLVAGYSLNDTIVVFDRIREELLLKPTAKLRDVVNSAISKVLSRSLLTSFTTLLASVSLYIWGTGVITDIAFTFTIGIIAGTFSSIFIASPVFYWWHKGDRRHVEERHDILPKYEWEASSKASQ